MSTDRPDTPALRLVQATPTPTPRDEDALRPATRGIDRTLARLDPNHPDYQLLRDLRRHLGLTTGLRPLHEATAAGGAAVSAPEIVVGLRDELDELMPLLHPDDPDRSLLLAIHAAISRAAGDRPSLVEGGRVSR